MPIYLLMTDRAKRWGHPAGEARRHMVIRAPNENAARQFATIHAEDEGEAAWLDPSTTVKIIDPDGDLQLLGWA